MFEMEKKPFKGLHGVNLDILDEGGFGRGSGGKKDLFETVIFSGFNNIEDTFDWFKATI